MTDRGFYAKQLMGKEMVEFLSKHFNYFVPKTVKALQEGLMLADDGFVYVAFSKLGEGRRRFLQVNFNDFDCYITCQGENLIRNELPLEDIKIDYEVMMIKKFNRDAEYIDEVKNRLKRRKDALFDNFTKDKTAEAEEKYKHDFSRLESIEFAVACSKAERKRDK